jgi:hypothetical protein
MLLKNACRNRTMPLSHDTRAGAGLPDDEPAQNDTMTVAVGVSVWKQIDTLAAQIESPVVAFSLDPLVMAQQAIEDMRNRATLLRDLIPAAALK